MNHARRHAVGGSDPIEISSIPLNYARIYQTGSQTFTTPTGFNAIPVQGNFSTTDATLMADDVTHDGIKVLQTLSGITVQGHVHVQRNGVGHGNMPQYLAVGMTEWTTSGGTPGSTFYTDSMRQWVCPAATADNVFGSIGFGVDMFFELTNQSVFINKSYALWLSVAGVAADWLYGDARLRIIKDITQLA